MASQHPEVPGEPTKIGTALLETATSAIQGFGPLNKIHQHLCAFGISYSKERENRGYISGPEHGIHPMANGGGKGLKTHLRETDCNPSDSSLHHRVFV